MCAHILSVKFLCVCFFLALSVAKSTHKHGLPLATHFASYIHTRVYNLWCDVSLASFYIYNLRDAFVGDVLLTRIVCAYFARSMIC